MDKNKLIKKHNQLVFEYGQNCLKIKELELNNEFFVKEITRVVQTIKEILQEEADAQKEKTPKKEISENVIDIKRKETLVKEEEPEKPVN